MITCLNCNWKGHDSDLVNGEITDTVLDPPMKCPNCGNVKFEFPPFEAEVNAEPEPEEHINVTFGLLKDNDCWDVYCAWSGINPYALNEGLATCDERVNIPLSKVHEWGLFKKLSSILTVFIMN